MLVLSRKEGERLLIGDNITLVISKVVGNRVTIAIEAPKDVKVMRAELIELGVAAAEPVQSDVPEKNVTGRNSRVTSVGLKGFTSSVRRLQRNVG